MRADRAEVDGPRDRAATLAEAVDAAMTPAPDGIIEEWLAELSVIAPKRADDGLTETLRLRAYTSRLRAYPADVAKAALLDHLWPFWPSWAELHEVCERLARERRLILSAARRAAEATEEPTRERIAPDRAAAILREVFGDRDPMAAVAARTQAIQTDD